MLSKFVQRCARAVGIKIRRPAQPGESTAWLLGCARVAGVTLIDLGAKTCQFGQTMIAVGWKHRLVLFEPLSAPHVRLVKTAARHPQWHVAPRTANGAQQGVSGGRDPDRLR